MCNVAWIGLGRMGGPMAANLVDAGHGVRGVEIDLTAATAAAKRGIVLAGSVAEAVRDADVVFTMLPTGQHVRELLTGDDGVFGLLPEGALVVDCSTIDIATARFLHEQADQADIGFLDAPVSGGVTGAHAGTLTIMVGGSAENLEKAGPLLQCMGSYVVHVGHASAGQAMKIVNNMMAGINVAAACEGAVLAQRLGLDSQVLFDVVTRSSGDSWALRTWFPLPGVVPTAPSSHGFAPGFTTDLLVKDVELAVRAGDETDTPLSAAKTALKLLQGSAAAGAGQRDCSALVLELGARIEEEVAS